MNHNNIELGEGEPNEVSVVLIYGDSAGVGIMDRADSDNLVKEQAAQTLLDQMDRTATVYARRRERLDSVIRARKTRQHVAWASASRERRLHA